MFVLIIERSLFMISLLFIFMIFCVSFFVVRCITVMNFRKEIIPYFRCLFENNKHKLSFNGLEVPLGFVSDLHIWVFDYFFFTAFFFCYFFFFFFFFFFFGLGKFGNVMTF